MEVLNKKYEGILSFYNQYTKLTELLRKGWVIRKVPAKHLESVSDHTLQVVMLAYTFLYELDVKDVEEEKLAPMCFIHDLAETIADDTPDIYIKTEEDKKRRHEEEKKALQEILSVLSPELAQYYYSLWEEFEQRQTPTAQFVFEIDKLDAVMKARKYGKQFQLQALFEEFYLIEEQRGSGEVGPVREFVKYLKGRD